MHEAVMWLPYEKFFFFWQTIFSTSTTTHTPQDTNHTHYTSSSTTSPNGRDGDRGGASRGRRGLDGECGAGWVRFREKHGYVAVGGATVGARSRETQK